MENAGQSLQPFKDLRFKAGVDLLKLLLVTAFSVLIAKIRSKRHFKNVYSVITVYLSGNKTCFATELCNKDSSLTHMTALSFLLNILVLFYHKHLMVETVSTHPGGEEKK